MKKKLLAVLLAASMVIGCTACGQSGGSEGTGSNTSSETTESTDQASAGDEKVITMWSVATEGSATANGVSKAIATYESNPRSARQLRQMRCLIFSLPGLAHGQNRS